MAEKDEERTLRISRLRLEVHKDLNNLKAGRFAAISTPEEISEMIDVSFTRAMKRLEAGNVEMAG